MYNIVYKLTAALILKAPGEQLFWALPMSQYYFSRCRNCVEDQDGWYRRETIKTPSLQIL